MLVLTRKVGEAIRIGADVTVQVLEVRGGQIRLGLTAPAGVRILREEVLRAMEGADGQGSGSDDAPDPASSADGNKGHVSAGRRAGVRATSAAPSSLPNTLIRSS